MFKVIIYWTKKSTPDIIRKTKYKYGITGVLTVNHTMECEVSSDVLCALQEAQELGYIQIRKIEKIDQFRSVLEGYNILRTGNKS